MAKKKYKVKKAIGGYQALDAEEAKLPGKQQLGEQMGSKMGGVVEGGVAAVADIADTISLNNQDVDEQVGVGQVNPYEHGVGGKAALKNAATGAKAGMAFGPWGAAIGGTIGAGSGLVKGLVNAKKREEWENAQDTYMDAKKVEAKYANEDPYAGLKYKKGTKYKVKANQKVSQKSNIEFEGGEPVFSPKKADGTRDLLYFDPNGPKHSEGGIPGNVTSGKYKLKGGTKSAKAPVEIPEGSAIVTAKKSLGKQAVIAHQMGNTEAVEKIIAKMPEDKGKNKAPNGIEEIEAKLRDRSLPLAERKALEAQRAKLMGTSKTGKAFSTTESDASTNKSFSTEDFSDEDYGAAKQHNADFVAHQNVLKAKRDQLGRDLSPAEQKQAFEEYNKVQGSDLSLDKYQSSVDNLDNVYKKYGHDINLKGVKEGGLGKYGTKDQTGIFGKRNYAANFNLGERPAKVAPIKPDAAPAGVNGKIPVTGPMSTPGDKPLDERGFIPSPRLSDMNNIYQGLKKPEVEVYDRFKPEKFSYYDLSDPSRRESVKAARLQKENAVNLSGGNAGNVRANAYQALAGNAERQQKINNFELGRFDDTKKQNVAITNDAGKINTDISMKERDANAANRQATKDQFQAGLVGFDEDIYRDRVTNDKYNVDMQRNDIEKKKLNLLKDFVPNYQVDDSYNVNYGGSTYKKGAKKVKYKPKSKKS